MVVDNGSTDGSVQMVAEKHPSATILQNSRNLGFAAACNQGIRASSAPLIATLNNDTLPEPQWLAELVEGMRLDTTVGMCASKMLFHHVPHMVNSTGISLDRAGIAWDRGGGEADDPGEDRPVEVFGPCAGAALYRRTMLDRIGLFDEDFFAYLEDVDLAWRARLAGWRCLYVPTARVYHVHSATAVEGSPFKSFLLGRNKIATIVKNYPNPGLLKYLPAILFYDLASLPYALMVRGDASPLKGRLAALGLLPRLILKRREVQRQRVVPSSQLTRLMEPLASPLSIPRRYKHLRRLVSSRAATEQGQPRGA